MQSLHALLHFWGKVLGSTRAKFLASRFRLDDTGAPLKAPVSMEPFMPRHLTKSELHAGLPDVLASPKDNGELLGIVVRPEKGQRVEPDSVAVSFAGGLEGDHWAKGCWKSTEDGQPHPDVQVCIMNARCIGLIAQERSNWAPAGDNFFLDMDLSEDNLAPGQRLAPCAHGARRILPLRLLERPDGHRVGEGEHHLHPLVEIGLRQGLGGGDGAGVLAQNGVQEGHFGIELRLHGRGRRVIMLGRKSDGDRQEKGQHGEETDHSPSGDPPSLRHFMTSIHRFLQHRGRAAQVRKRAGGNRSLCPGIP